MVWFSLGTATKSEPSWEYQTKQEFSQANTMELLKRYGADVLEECDLLVTNSKS